ncbi:histidinol-phosphate transaminase [unidentified eubacterium SCB49]|nr:histidinol-phosphate transaminase [unidentified eubacterium SCB49]
MNNISNLVRPSIAALKGYSSARDEFTGQEGIFLDANENPYGNLNRYPDPYQRQLKQEISKLKHVSETNIFIGNGSDEIIDITFRVFCEPAKDKAIILTPTYGMYEVSAAINNVALINVPLTNSFDIDIEATNKATEDPDAKLLIICSPNNPTGNLLDRKLMEKIITNFKGVVLVDEAYIDFSEEVSCNQWITKFSNLIVMQTLSKAYGLASARVGIGYANETIISYFNKVKPPYNVSGLNQAAAIATLQNNETYLFQKEKITIEREKLEEALDQNSLVIKRYPTVTNFILAEVTDADAIYDALTAKNIIIRNRTKQINNCLRFTVGTPEENEQLINALIKLAP